MLFHMFMSRLFHMFIYIYIHRVSEEERTILWEIIASVILSKNLYMNMCPIPNGFRDRALLVVWLGRPVLSFPPALLREGRSIYSIYIYIYIYSFTYSYLCCFTFSYLCCFTCSYQCCFTCSYLCCFTCSYLCCFTCSYLCCFTFSYLCCFTCSVYIFIFYILMYHINIIM
jgi:hypothetical protein